MGFLAEARAREQLHVSYGAQAPGWRFDTEQVRRAIAKLALTRPVKVAMTNGRGGRARAGVHRYVDGAHVITVLRGLNAPRASWVLWHELEHARQLEHDFGCDDRAFSHAYDRDTRRYERQADWRADREDDREPLLARTRP